MQFLSKPQIPTSICTEYWQKFIHALGKSTPPFRYADFNETQNWSTVLHGSFMELGRKMYEIPLHTSVTATTLYKGHFATPLQLNLTCRILWKSGKNFRQYVEKNLGFR